MNVTLNIEDTVQALLRLIPTGVGCLLTGQPGIGKTSVMRLASAVYQAKGRFTVPPAIWSTTEVSSLDIFGLWEVKDGRTVRCPASLIDFEHAQLVGIDEMGDCEKLEQSAWYRLALDRMVGDQPLHADSYVVAATNRPEDSAAARELSSALADRFCTVNIRADFEATIRYGYKRKWNPDVLGFLRSFGQQCIDDGFNGDDVSISCTPRGVERLSRIAPVIPKDNLDLANALAAGCIGELYGPRWVAYRGLDVPSVDLVWKDPQTAPILEENQSIYNAAICSNVDAKTITAALKYCLRLDDIERYGLFADLRNALGKEACAKSPAYVTVAQTCVDLI